MEFKTADEAYNFYNAYACYTGFSIRRATQSKSRNGVSSIRFVCSKEGLSRRQRAEQKGLVKTPEREHGIRRTKCKASLRIKLENRVILQVSVFSDEHNHELIQSPSKNRNLRSQKHLSKEDKQLILELNAQNVGVSQILEFLAKKRGGKRNLHFKKKDVSNEIATHNKQIIGVDVETTLVYFQMKQKEDPLFFYAIDRDESGAARHILGPR
jgi:FAR1 DNA-binding domain